MRLCLAFALALPVLACGEVSEERTENCFDLTDDNENGMTDCADPLCATVATCAPVPDEGGFEAGVFVEANEPCPDGFTDGETFVYRGLQASCTGCTCAPEATICRAQLWTYASAMDCNADATLTGGIMYPDDITEVCTANPVSYGYGGARARISVVEQTCSTSGTPAPLWETTKKFCKASRHGAGCGPQQVCVPRMAPALQCAVASGTFDCAGYATAESDWYTGPTDASACEACGCTAEGGSCDAYEIEIGSDYTCVDTPPAILGDGEKSCTYSYSPPAKTGGAPTAPTSCTAEAVVAAGVSPTGPTTVCCGLQ
jgi:hypothetical protein